ncbi:MAG TPA: hypothetical protein VHJ83_00075 [Micromonosporaceae bacterium]|jgi:hypothetical protein|nr:hypothetical protein [Micromonosporaceae bacterium]
MYGWIWNKLPFGLPGKIIGSLLLIGIAVWLLWYHLFPAVEPLLPFDDVQVEGPTPPGGGETPTGPVEPSPGGSVIPT